VTKSFPAIAVLALIAMLVAAGCGSSNDSSSSSGGGGYGGGGESTTAATTAATTESSGGGAAAIVSVTTVPKLGKVIVDSKGFTLYDFHKDKGGKSSCYEACEQVWPPLTTEGKPQVGEGAMASKLGTTKRKDGTLQVTYAGWPLYTYEADKKPGDANGNDFTSFGAQWYALLPSGEEAGD
jgi:predicted lipoprotein with Yx(FWY)xxD motif